MPKANTIVTNFSSGYWSNRMDSRIDLEGFYRSCRILENMLLTPQGSADFRPGTAFVVNGKTDALKIRLIPFSIKGVGEYILELGNLYLRVIKCSTHAQLESAPDTPIVTVTPWGTADLFEIKYAQTKDAMYFTHPSYSPRKLVRTDDTTNWTLSAPTFSGWDLSTETDITAITQANPASVTAVGHGLVTGNIAYFSDILGMIELNQNAYKVTRISDDVVTLDNTNSTTYTAYISGGHTKKAGNIFGTANNYPSAIGFYCQRMVLAGTNNNPDTKWLSWVGDYLDYKWSALEDNGGLEFTSGHDRGLFIKWLVGKNAIVLGADSCEVVLTGMPISETLYGDTVESGYGSADIQGKLLGDHVFFVQKGGKKLRAFQFSEESGSWYSPDMTFYAEDITGDGITEIALQTNHDPILWCVRSDGKLVGLTYEPFYGVKGWHEIILADTIAGSSEVESIAIVQGSAEDEIYVSVKRTVNDVTKRFIEYFKPRNFGTDQKNCYFVDCGITWDGGGTATITDISQADPPIVTSAAHPFDDGDMVEIVDVVESDEGLLDLSTFVEVDPGADVALAANTATVTTLNRDLRSLVYNQLGHEFLDTVFTYTFQINLTAAFETAGQSMVATWGVANKEDVLSAFVGDDDSNILTFVALREAGGDHKFQIWEIYGGVDQTVTFDIAVATATDYYVTVARTITGGDNDCGTLTISVYSDSGRTTLVESKSISLNSVVKYTYLYAVQNYDDAWSDHASFTLTDLSGPANRSSYNQVVFTVDDDDAANTFTLDDEDDADINGFEFKKYISGGYGTESD